MFIYIIVIQHLYIEKFGQILSEPDIITAYYGLIYPHLSHSVDLWGGS